MNLTYILQPQNQTEKVIYLSPGYQEKLLHRLMSLTQTCQIYWFLDLSVIGILMKSKSNN